MKKIFLLLLLLFPMIAWAEEYSGTTGDCTWHLDTETGVLTISGNGSMDNYSFNNTPWYSYRTSINYVAIDDGVQNIGNFAFHNCTELTSIIIPSNVTRIGSYAFYNCEGLTSITIPSSVTSIGDNAFNSCSGLIIVNIPESVTTIEPYAFQNCENVNEFRIFVTDWLSFCQKDHNYEDAGIDKLTLYSYNSKVTNIVIPNGLTSINNYAFYNCTDITSISIPSSVTNIGINAFVNCFSLTDVNFENGNQNLTIEIGSVKKDYYDEEYECWSYYFKEVSPFYGSSIKNVYLGRNVSTISKEYEDEGLVYYYDQMGLFSGITSLQSAILSPNVTDIKKKTFYGCTGLTSVTIPSSVTSIGEDAFSGCSGLTSVTIPEGVTSIGNRAFDNCSGLTSVIVPDIAAWCGISFYNSSRSTNPLSYAHHIYSDENTEITNLIIPKGVTSIGYDAFYGCNGLTSVTIPEGVTSIGNRAFQGCTGLTSVTSFIEEPFAYSNSSFSTISSNCVLYVPVGTRNAYIYAGWTTNIFKGGIVEMEQQSNIVFTDANVKALCIAKWDLSGDGELSYTEAEAVTSLGEVFKGNTTIISFDELQFFSGLTNIPSNAFYNCSGLTSITIPSSVTSIGYRAFSGCSGLTSVIIPEGVISIEPFAFSGCSRLTSVTIPSSMTSIGSYAFSGCDGLTSVTIPEGVTSIGDSAFDNCSGLTSVTISEGVTSIGNYAFQKCSRLTSVTIPSSVTSIGDSAFDNCSGLTSVTISEGVTSIGNDAFYNCSRLTKVIVPDIVAWCGISFDGSNSNPLYYAHHLYSDENTEITNLVIPSSVTSIGNLAFYHCSGLTSVTIPSSVTSIGSNAFYNCEGLTKAIVPDITAWCGISFEASDSNPLYYAHHLYSDENTEITNLVIPSSVTSIGDSAFDNCSGLTSVTISEGVTSIGNYAFYNCEGLTSVTIPSSVTSIGYSAFFSCSILTKVIVPDITAWCGISFGNTWSNPLIYARHIYSDDNTKITNLVIPSSVTSIGSYAFYNCSGLTSLTIPKGVTSIGGSAFRACSGLTKIKVGRNSPLSIDNSTFSNSSNTTLYVPKGSSSAYASASYWQDFGIMKEFPDSDVNQDEVVDVVDVVDIARFVIDTPSDTFDDFLADINNDDNVNIADAVALVNEIVGDQDFTKTRRAPMNADDEWLTLTETDGQNLSISLNNVRDYTAFQFDLYASDDAVIKNVVLNKLRKQKHQLLYNKLGDGHYRIVCLSTSNKVFNGTDGELLSIEAEGINIEDIILKNIHFFTVDGGDYNLRYVKETGEATGIDEIKEVEVPLITDGAWYTVTGAKLDEKPSVPGIYIHNGRKVLVK